MMFAVLLVLLIICHGNCSNNFDTCDATSECDTKTALSQDLYSNKCSIPKVVDLTQDEFLFKYAFKMPVIFVNATDNALFQELCEKNQLLKNYGDRTITLSTANTHSYDKVDILFKEYMDRIFVPQDYNKSGQETLYFFGNHIYEEWKDLFDNYVLPPYELPGKDSALSFGIAGAGTGVPFHFHGPGFAEVIRGRKRWFLTPYEQKPMFDPNKTTLRWLSESYSDIALKDYFYECVLGPNEILYFPDKWWHATLNVEDAVFMSTFLS